MGSFAGQKVVHPLTRRASPSLDRIKFAAKNENGPPPGGDVADRSTAQLVTGSFMDYTMPRADMLPKFEIALEEVRCKTNPIGVKGIGESGTIGAPPVVINAIIDALAPLGIDGIDMPATPNRVWQAIQSAKGVA
jgi:carbon-monoxide dehydrogenase large subunit